MKNNIKEIYYLFMSNMPRHIYHVLLMTLVVWAFVTFKKIEPYVFPVVSSFKVLDKQVEETFVAISGTMKKERSCVFNGIVAYSGDSLVAVEFTETNQVVSRVEGEQSWGWWIITPPVIQLTIYADHTCYTGSVRTKLFEGVL